MEGAGPGPIRVDRGGEADDGPVYVKAYAEVTSEPAKNLGNGKGARVYFQVPGVQAVFSVPKELVVHNETPKEKRARVASMRSEQASVIVSRITDEEAEQLVLRDLVSALLRRA